MYFGGTYIGIRRTFYPPGWLYINTNTSFLVIQLNCVTNGQAGMYSVTKPGDVDMEGETTHV